jgi:polyphosphate kinase
MMRLIEQEAVVAKKGRTARILIKVNSLIDPEAIQAMYAASKAGVKVDLVVRGICGLVPGVKGLSENITVRSLLGRFLEHSRVYHFHNAPAGKRTYLGSADWMPRNFFRRVEVVFPVEDNNMENEVLETMDGFFRDNEFATELRTRGNYVPAVKRGRKAFALQNSLVEKSIDATNREVETLRLRRASGKPEDQSKGN